MRQIVRRSLVVVVLALAGCTTSLPPQLPVDAVVVTGRDWNCAGCYK